MSRITIQRRYSRHFRACLLIVAGVALSANLALGGTILVRDAPGGEDYAGNQPGNYLTGTGGGLFGTPTGGPFEGLAVGTYDLETDSGAGFQSLRTYCLEATQFLAVGTQPTILFGQPYNEAPLSSIAGLTATEAGYLEVLWANAFADSQTSHDKAAAFQSIIWELVGDNSFNLTQGAFRFDAAADPGAAAIANTWYANIVNHTWTSSTPLRGSQRTVAGRVGADPGAGDDRLAGDWSSRRRGNMRMARTNLKRLVASDQLGWRGGTP